MPDVGQAAGRRAIGLLGADRAGSDSRFRRPAKRLRKATESLKGNLLVGVINSIGVRRDAGSVDTAQGPIEGRRRRRRIGRGRGLGPGRQRRGDRRPAQVAGRLRRQPSARRWPRAASCAPNNCWPRARRRRQPRFMTKSARPTCRSSAILEATRGAILARDLAGIPLLVEQLKFVGQGFVSRSA